MDGVHYVKSFYTQKDQAMNGCTLMIKCCNKGSLTKRTQWTVTTWGVCALKVIIAISTSKWCVYNV